jgi:hypothetical protein
MVTGLSGFRVERSHTETETELTEQEQRDDDDEDHTQDKKTKERMSETIYKRRNFKLPVSSVTVLFLFKIYQFSK